jgi:RNA polymerase sigma-70 factor (ECF subfamily)
VDRFRGGDRRAFDELVLRYQDRVYALCVRWLGETESAEELAQDVFVALFRALPGFRGEAQLSTWIFKVTLNHCRNRRLHRMRRGHGRHDPIGPVGDDEAPGREVVDDGAAADRGTHHREASELVHEALAGLDDEHREIVLLRDVEELSYEEISAILELPLGTVKSRIHRARAELAVLLVRRGVGRSA